MDSVSSGRGPETDPFKLLPIFKLADRRVVKGRLLDRGEGRVNLSLRPIKVLFSPRPEPVEGNVIH